MSKTNRVDIHLEFCKIENSVSTLKEEFRKLQIENQRYKLRNLYAISYLENIEVDKELLFEVFQILKGEKDFDLQIEYGKKKELEG